MFPALGRFTRRLTLPFITMTVLHSASASEAPFYISSFTSNTESDGIYVGAIDSKTGKMSPVRLAAKATNPLFVCVSPNRKFLYAAMESEGGAVGAYAIEEDGSLTFLNSQPSGGEGACHVSTDTTGRFVFVANYSSGDIACFPVQDEGSLGERSAYARFEGSGPDLNRQKQSYAHGIHASADNRFIYVCDLGADKVWSFRFDANTGSLTPTDPEAGVVPPGGGPRHLVFSPDGLFAYANNEMGISTTVFARNPDTGILTALETVSCSPEAPGPRKGITTAEITLHPNGKWLYVSNRGDDLIAVHSVGPDGRLTLLENTPAGTAIPSGMAIDPSGKWLVVAGKDGNALSAFAIDQKTGQLRSTGQSVPAPAGFGVTFLPKS